MVGGSSSTQTDFATNLSQMVAQSLGIEMRVDEAIGDYEAAIAQVMERSGEVSAEADRKIGTVKEEGIMSLKEQGAQADFEGRMAMTQAEMVASHEEAKLGASGVRPGGSPLLAAQQNVDLAFASADRTIEKGSAGVAIGGVKIKTGLANIAAQSTMLTSEYARRQTEMERKKKYLELNKQKMIDIAIAGGAPALQASFVEMIKNPWGTW